VAKRRFGSNCDTAYTCHVRYCSISDIAGGKHSAADVVAKAQAVLSEAELLRAISMWLLPAEHAAADLVDPRQFALSAMRLPFEVAPGLSTGVLLRG